MRFMSRIPYTETRSNIANIREPADISGRGGLRVFRFNAMSICSRSCDIFCRIQYDRGALFGRSVFLSVLWQGLSRIMI
jgi:hypothetical protein